MNGQPIYRKTIVDYFTTFRMQPENILQFQQPFGKNFAGRLIPFLAKYDQKWVNFEIQNFLRYGYGNSTKLGMYG